MVFGWFLYFQQQKYGAKQGLAPPVVGTPTNRPTPLPTPPQRSTIFFPLINSAGGNSWAELKRISSRWTFSGYHAKKTPGKMCYVDDPNNVASNIQQFKIPKCLPSDSPSTRSSTRLKFSSQFEGKTGQIQKSQLSNPFHRHLFSRCISQLPWTVGN